MYTLKYRTFDQLMADVKSQFKRLNADGMIDDQDYIPVVASVNKELGLKINVTKQRLLEIRNGRAKLPNDFQVFNGALMLNHFTEVIPATTYGETKVIAIPPMNYEPDQTISVCEPIPAPVTPTPTPCDPCNHATTCGDCELPYQQCYCVSTNDIHIDCEGKQTVVLQKFNTYTRRYTSFRRMNLINSPQYVDEYCLTTNNIKAGKLWIKDGFIYSSVQNGELYLNYEGIMETEDGQLMVLDHDIVNNFYNYAVKKKILENAIMDNYPVSQMQVQLIETEYRLWRTKSLALIKMPEYDTIRDTRNAVRKAYFKKYFSHFL